MQEIIVVKQLPVIEEQLQSIKERVAEKVNAACALVCTEDTVKDVKAARAELSKDFKEFEEKRKEVKAAVMSPYERFEAVYKDCITDSFKVADAQLKSKIGAVESALKEEKAKEIRDYFAEYCKFKGVDFVEFEQAGVNVTLSASVKSLKESVKSFIDKVSGDLRLISTQEKEREILYEYRQHLDVSRAITSVSERYKALEAESAAQAAREQNEAQTAEAVAEVEALAPPTTPAPPKKIYTVAFTVRGTIEELKALKGFLTDGGYDYE